MNYRVVLVEEARKTLLRIPSNYRKTVFNRIVRLGRDPEKQGKPLLGDLAGCRSVYAAGRYRVIFSIDKRTVIVVVVAVGMRKEGDKKDVYKLARKIYKYFLEGGK